MYVKQDTGATSWPSVMKNFKKQAVVDFRKDLQLGNATPQEAGAEILAQTRAFLIKTTLVGLAAVGVFCIYKQYS